MIKRGMMAFGGTIGGGMAYKGASNVREPSFCDPAQVQALADRTVENASARQHWGFFGFNMTDEVHLQQNTAVEVDASENALAGWRKWAREEHGTIAAANAGRTNIGVATAAVADARTARRVRLMVLSNT